MNPMTLILTFAWIAILGLSFTILNDFLWPILIAAVVFTLLVVMAIPRKYCTNPQPWHIRAPTSRSCTHT
jgi:hypothetical protein